MRSRLILSCTIWVVICLIVSGLSGFVSATNITGWYETLNKPSFNPPSWIFGPVWTILYIMIGIAGGLLWQERKRLQTLFYFYILQLVFNFSWSFIFFIGENIRWALIDISALWLSLACLIISAFFKKRSITWLLLPYLFWVSFAVILNFYLYQQN